MNKGAFLVVFVFNQSYVKLIFAISYEEISDSVYVCVCVYTKYNYAVSIEYIFSKVSFSKHIKN